MTSLSLTGSDLSSGARLRQEVLMERQFEILEDLFEIAPSIVGFHLRDVIGHILAKTRKEVFQQTTTGLRRGKKAGWLKWTAFPFNKARSKSQLRAAFRKVAKSGAINLQSFKGFLFDKSEVVRAHEFGDTTTAKGKLMPVPLDASTRRIGKQDLADVRRGLNLFVIRRKRRGTRLPLLAREHPTKRDSKGRPTAEPLFALRKTINLKPRLGVRKTWDRLDPWRRQLFELTVNLIIDDMVKAGRLGRFAA